MADQVQEQKQEKAQQKTQQSALDKAQAAVEEAGRRLVAARKALADAQQEVDRLTQAIEDAQPSDSPVKKAKDTLDAARIARNEAVDKFKATEAYRDAIKVKPMSSTEEVQKSLDRGKELMDQDSSISLAEAHVTTIRKTYESMRFDLVKADLRWPISSKPHGSKIKAPPRTCTTSVSTG